MMFVLSAGFLMAQGVFTYQAVLVDADGNLVANQTVNATVTIQSDGYPDYVQTINGVQTSLNGMAILPIGDATMNVDWATAKIKVDYTVTSDAITVPTGTLEQVPAVPFALQTNADLTTQMIVDYIKGATMDDVDAILNAMIQGSPVFRDTLLATVVDSVKANYELAKQVFLYYVSHATPAHLQVLYDSLMSNTELVNAIDTVLARFVKNNKEDVYDILRAYALSLTVQDVNDILDTIPSNVRDYIVNQALAYLTTDDTLGVAKSQILIPVIQDYAKNITKPEVKALIEAVEGNSVAFPIMLNQFRLWMDEYFNTHYTGGSNVETVVADTISKYYYVCNDAVDLVQLKTDLEALTACFDYASVLNFTVQNISGNDYIVGTVTYTGSDNIGYNSLTVRVNDSYNVYLSDSYVTFDATHKTITVKFTTSQVSSSSHTVDVGDVLKVTLGISSTCNGSSVVKEIVGNYTID